MLSTQIKDITALQKKINTLVCYQYIDYSVKVVGYILLQETRLEQKRADRHSLLKGCKVNW